MSNAPSAPLAGPPIPGSIFLVGLMGAGKTSVGRLLAKRFGKTFYDCDQEIERRTGVKIPVIFEIEGEAGFRAREANVLKELAGLNDIVLATGGGAVLRPASRERLKANGTVIYLFADPDTLWDRVRNSRHRPMLQAVDPRQRLFDLYAQRDALYREVADHVIPSDREAVVRFVCLLQADAAP